MRGADDKGEKKSGKKRGYEVRSKDESKENKRITSRTASVSLIQFDYRGESFLPMCQQSFQYFPLSMRERENVGFRKRERDLR
jgi:hypothetical protein